MVKFKDKSESIKNYPEINALSNWTYQDSLSGYVGKTKMNLSQIQQQFKEIYNLDKKAVAVQKIGGTWASMI
ncbi:hypothetical protein ACVRZD_04560 [Streptococcus hongkongensis]|nr:hypothetical protein NC01_01655 [Streptococcus uberis]